MQKLHQTLLHATPPAIEEQDLDMVVGGGSGEPDTPLGEPDAPLGEPDIPMGPRRGPSWS